MMLRTYNNLRTFVLVERYGSFSEAAKHLYLTKGALSHQIKRLEDELGFDVFYRDAKGLSLTSHGKELLQTVSNAFFQIENKVDVLRSFSDDTLTIGASTYFASRWLSPRLMGFMQLYPNTRLRVQPLIDIDNFAGHDVDIAIRWGDGDWQDCEIEKLFTCPAWPSGNQLTYQLIQTQGMNAALEQLTLLRDQKGSNAWTQWFQKAGISMQNRRDTLIIPDPNVRVQATIDGQGIALQDAMVNNEIDSGKLFKLSHVSLNHFGYFLAYPKADIKKPSVEAFIQWIKQQVE